LTTRSCSRTASDAEAMNNLILTGLSLLVLLSGGGESANTLEAARELYEQGDFDGSAKLAVHINTADGYSLAARARLMKARFYPQLENRPDLLQQVINDATLALELEPDHLDAHLQMAMALGMLADERNPVAAYLRGYAVRGRQHIDQALKIAPDDPWANGLLGMWHLQIVHRATAFMGEQLYEASVEDGLYYCDRARQLSRDELQVVFGCAVSLYEIDPVLYAEKVCRILEDIAARLPSGIEEKFIMEDARSMLEIKKTAHR